MMLVALSAVVGVASSHADRPETIKSPCGSVVVPEKGKTGVVCLSFCDAMTAATGCYGPEAPSIRAEGMPVATGAGDVLIAIPNGPVTLNHFASALRSATGWQVEVRGVDGEASLQERDPWQGDWGALGKLTLHGEQGVRIRIAADQTKQVLYLEPAI